MDLEPFETQLARVLRERSTAAPVADPVDQVRRGMRRRRRTQRLQVAAAALGVLVVAVGAVLVVRPHVGPAPQPVTSTSAPAPTSSPTAVPAPVVPVPAEFQASDLSFLSTSSAFALGGAPCGLLGCGVLAVTHDGGATWSRRTFPPAALATPDGVCPRRPCVGHLRFVRAADGSEVGYAYGPDLAVTRDGGRSWVREPVQGDVVALEAGRSGVVRLLDPQGGCPCSTLVVQRADVGSSTWRTVLTPARGREVDSGSLVRQGNRLVVLLRGHTAGGALDARSQVFVSTDDGASWTDRQEPCGPLTADEVDTTQVALAPGSLTVLCRYRVARPAGGDTFVRVSTDDGATFGPARTVPAPYSAELLATVRGALVVSAKYASTNKSALVNGDFLVRSTDGGSHWARVALQAPAGSPYGSRFLAFTTDTVGTWVGPDPRVLWRTTDAGATWTSAPVR